MTETPMTEQESLDLVQDSLLRRMRTMHGLYYQAVGSMELEHVNHFERAGVLPIAFSLFHYTNMHDGAFMMLSGQLPIWDEDWQARVQMAIDDAGKERPVSDMIHQRIGDYDAFKEYQRTVFDRTEAHIAALDPADFQRVLVAPPFPPRSRVRTARCVQDRRASPCSTATSAGCISTACVTWARSNSRVASSAWRE